MFENVLQVESDSDFNKSRQEPSIDHEKMEGGYNALFQADEQAAMDSYWTVRGEREELQRSPSSEELKSKLHADETDTIYRGLQEEIIDPTRSMEDRAAISQLQLSEQRKETPMSVKLGEKLLTQDNGPNETEGGSETRALFINHLQKQMDFRATQQAVMDDANFSKTNTGLSLLGDMAQLVIPFVEQSNVAEALNAVGMGDESLGAFFMMGDKKKAFYDAVHAMPLDARKLLFGKLAEIAHESNTTAFMTNGLLEQQMMQEIVYGGSYDDSFQQLDNVIGWIDMTVFGKPAAWAVKGVKNLVRAGKSIKELRTLEAAIKTQEAGQELMRLMKMDGVRTQISPVSPIRVAAETNPEAGRAMYFTVVEDASEEAAGALGATSKMDVVGDSMLPEFHKEAIRNKVHNIEAHVEKLRIKSQAIRDSLDESSVNSLTRKEVESAASHVVDNLKDVVGLVSRGNMFKHTNTPTGSRISGAYGHADSGWTSSGEALDQAEMALRAHGIERGDLYLMERLPGTDGYVRVDAVTPEAAGDFLVGFDYNYQIKFSDIMSWDKFSVHKNFLDRVPLLAKHSINRHFFDPASVLDKHLFLGANARVDKSAQITKDFLAVGKGFTDGFGKASKESQASMYKYILDANENQIPFNINTLRGEYGFSNDEIRTLASFREYWDTVWQARNVTDIRALRDRGYGIFANAKGDNLFVKPVEKGQVTRGGQFYDPESGLTVFLDEVELSKLYEQGHTIGKLRRPMEVAGKKAEQVIVKSNSGWRPLNDTDKAFQYRHGYFQRIYKAPVFVVRQETDSAGREYWRAVATADTLTDANVYIKGLQRDNPGVTFKPRHDVKDPREQGAFEMDTFESSGMSNQHVRGEKLIDSTAVVRGTEDSNVLSPVDAIIAASRSMGRKVAMDDFIRAAKKRFMETYKDQLPVEKGQIAYPRSMEEVGSTGAATSKEAADARATYEYISFLEYGYINSMDNVFKTIMKSLAERAGESGMRTLEVGLEKVGMFAPTSFAKNLAFQMYIATNPLRQAALNAHQATLLNAKFPKYVLSQRLAADMHAFMYLRMNIKMPKAAIKATGRTEGELKLMWKQYQKSGLSASIDQHNLIRGSMMDMVEESKFKGNILSRGLEKVQKVGFNLGEEINVNSAWLAHYDEASKAKKGLDASDYDRISGNARNFTFNMNRAGDMPYNANSLSLFFQYMQIPHKSLLQMSNRALTGAERTSLAMYNMVMFTLPPAAMYEWFGEILPDATANPELHEAVVSGLEFYGFSKMAELLTGQEVSMDWGNMAPSDATGIYEFIRHGVTTEMGQILANTPSGQLFAGGNPRITKFFKTVGSFVTPADPQDMSPTTLSNVFTDLASLSSGMSNLFKAKMALEHHKAYGSRGQVIDPSVSTPEAILMLFGFKTLDAARTAWVGMELYEESSAYTKDVNQWYKQMTMKLASEGTTADTDAYAVKVLSMSFLAFGSSQKALNVVRRNLDRDTMSGSVAIYDSILRQGDVILPGKLKAISNAAPEYAGKEQLMKTIELIGQQGETK